MFPMRFKVLWLSCTLFLCGHSIVQAAPNAAPTKWAVLVGIDKYQNDEISTLRYAVADTKAMQQALVQSGFPASNVFAMTGDAQGPDAPTSNNVIKRLNSLAERVGPEDTFLFYFSGHGYQQTEGHFLATVDADPTVPETLERTTLPISVLKRLMARIPAKRAIFIIDACRNDPERGKSGGQNTLTESFSKDLQLVAKGTAGGQSGSAVLLACSEGQRAWEWPEKGHGVFTYYLMEGLKGAAADARGEVTITELGDYVQNKVADWGLRNYKKQTPDLQQFGAAKIVVTQKSKTPILDSLRRPNSPPNPQPIVAPADVWPEDEIVKNKLKRLINLINICEDVRWETPATEPNAQTEPYISETWRARSQWPNIILTQHHRRGISATQWTETTAEYTIPVLSMMGGASKRTDYKGRGYPVVLETRLGVPLILQRTRLPSGEWVAGNAASTLTMYVQDYNMAGNIALEWKESIRVAIGSTLPDEPATTTPPEPQAVTPIAPATSGVARPKLPSLDQLGVRGELVKVLNNAGTFHAALGNGNTSAFETIWGGINGGFLRLRIGNAVAPSPDKLGKLIYRDIRIPLQKIDSKSIKVVPVEKTNYFLVSMETRDGAEAVGAIEPGQKEQFLTDAFIPFKTQPDAAQAAELLRQLLKSMNIP